MRSTGRAAPRNPDTEIPYDLVGIGAGPFNLGLAALASTVDELELLVLDARPELRWHPGLGFDDARLQVSFLADLVSLVDPTHPCSFLAYLRSVGRLYPFYVRERFHPTRCEFEDYLRWVAGQLPQVHFSQSVESVQWDADAVCFVVRVVSTGGGARRILARNVVLGLGTEPHVPGALRGIPADRIVVAADYLDRLPDVAAARHVTLVGSGQSGAEIALDLLRRNLVGGPALHWVTRTESFAPLDYTKLVLEMTTPSYVRYFHGLEEDTRDALVAAQWRHYKGISTDTLEEIHDLLYRRELVPDLAPVELRCGVEVRDAGQTSGGRVALRCWHRDSATLFERETDLVVAATGFGQRSPRCLDGLAGRIRRDRSGRFRVRLDHSLELHESIRGRIFVAHADLHSHGVAAPDLGIGAYRNAVILNAVCGREVYPLPDRTCFTSFDVPQAEAPTERVSRARASDRIEPGREQPASERNPHVAFP